MVTTPAAAGVSTPDALMDASERLVEDHVPPESELVSVILVPRQAVAGPDIVPVGGTVVTVTVLVAETLPQLLVNV